MSPSVLLRKALCTMDGPLKAIPSPIDRGATSIKCDADTSRPSAGDKALEKMIQDDRAAGCALLCAFLDAKILFQKEAVPLEELALVCKNYTAERAP